MAQMTTLSSLGHQREELTVWTKEPRPFVPCFRHM